MRSNQPVGLGMTEDERRDFLNGYDFLVFDLRGASGSDLPQILARWLGYVDANPDAAAALVAIEAQADMAAWFANLKSSARESEGTGPLGSFELPWSFNPTTYLAERLGLLRRFARRELNVQDFVVRFMYESGRTSPDAAAQRIVEKFAEPAFRELREWLRSRLADAPAPIASFASTTIAPPTSTRSGSSMS